MDGEECRYRSEILSLSPAFHSLNLGGFDQGGTVLFVCQERMFPKISSAHSICSHPR